MKGMGGLATRAEAGRKTGDWPAAVGARRERVSEGRRGGRERGGERTREGVLALDTGRLGAGETSRLLRLGRSGTLAILIPIGVN